MNPGVDEQVVGATVLFLGLGFTPAECVNILSGYIYDMVERVAQNVEPGTAATIAMGHFEWLNTRLTKQLSTEFQVAPQALQLLARNPNAALGASGSSGAPDANDGILTRAYYNWGRFAEAGEAGSRSWYGRTSTSTTASVGGASVAQEKTTTGKPPAAPPGPPPPNQSLP